MKCEPQRQVNFSPTPEEIPVSAVVLRAIAAVLSCLLLLGMTPSADAAGQKLTIRALTEEVLVGKTFTLFGGSSPAAKGVVVTRQVYRDNAWKSTGTALTNGKGDWKMVVTAPAWKETLKLRVQARIKGKAYTSAVVTVQAVRKLTPPSQPATEPTPEPTVDEGPEYVEPSPAVALPPLPDYTVEIDRNAGSSSPTIVIAANGKGNRILGADIARYQHPTSTLFPDGAPIDFVKMYKGGVRFLYIKASDGRDPGHSNAEKWYSRDRNDAQTAGIYTGFYHFAYFPASTVAADIIADAQAQADKALWRLASVGGYNALDLPYALDIEEPCVLSGTNGKCIRNVTKNAATLWVKTWLARIYEKTKRKPVVYASPSFLQGYLNRDSALRQYPLWVAHYDRDPAVPANFPGMKSDGTCFIHAWTLNTCTTQWAIWQYTSSGKATNFGIAGGNLDLNLYSGTSQEFLEFASGTWTPSPTDFLPFNETSTMVISNSVYSLTTEPFMTSIKVTRPTGLPVVSGSINFTITAGIDGIAPTAQQLAAIKTNTTRTGVGSWNVNITGLPAGNWIGVFTFTDSSRVHAATTGVQSLSITAPTVPTPETPPTTDTATATPGPSPTPSPTA